MVRVVERILGGFAKLGLLSGCEDVTGGVLQADSTALHAG